jgi:phosphoadenosine phosphosulfate reductase
VRGLDRTPEDVIADAVARHPDLVLLCSFQKEESVLVDLLVERNRDARIVAIDTGVLFDETYETWKRFEDFFGIEIERIDASRPGPEAWNREVCCSTTGAKVEALERALSTADAWITGIRREQGPTRAGTEQEETDAARGIAKYNPLAAWTEKDVWTRIFQRGLPYHPLHDQGYESIGCAPCTLPGAGREGRWAGSEKTECGLHVTQA